MSRSHYTNSADYIRGLGPCGKEGVVLSRSDASQIRQGISKAIGMDDEKLSMLLSDALENKSPEEIEKDMKKLITAIGYGA